MRVVTRILGIGNTLMGDDGIGPHVAELLRDGPHAADWLVHDRANADMGTLPYFMEPGRIIVVDALDIGAEPGDIYRFTPADAGLVSLRSTTTHGTGVGQVVAAARLLGKDPDVVVYGVQVDDVRPNPDRLSPAVAGAALKVARLIEEELLTEVNDAQETYYEEVV